MDQKSCATCQKPKADLTCGVCQSSICKKCAQFVAEDSFSFLPTRPEAISHTTYCDPCFAEHVVPALTEYEETMEKAKNVLVFFSDQGKETRTFSRKERPVKVENCADRDETVLRLAFLAAKENFNAIIDVSLSSKKVRIGGYQTSEWSGTAVPTQLEGKRFK